MPDMGLPVALRSILTGGRWCHQFVRFGLVGVLNTAFGYGVYALLILIGLAPWLALFLATVAGVLFNYRTTGRLVFQNRAGSLLPRYLAVYAGVYFVNALLLHAVMAAGAGPLAGQVWCQLVIVPLSFFLFRAVVFKKDVQGDSGELPPKG